MNKRTFAEARRALFDFLEKTGWTVKRGLKVPWARKGSVTLWFKPQALYYTTEGTSLEGAHSLHSDIRELTPVLLALLLTRVSAPGLAAVFTPLLPDAHPGSGGHQ